MALTSSPLHILQTSLEATYSNLSHRRMLVIDDISSPVTKDVHTPTLISQSGRPLTKSALLAPPRNWPTLCHHKADELRHTAEAAVISNWRWPSEAVKNKVFGFQLGRATALCFPLALDDRIDVMCRLCLILVLVDDIIDHPSCKNATAYKQRLISLMQGTQIPNKTEPAEYLLYDLWTEIRALDAVLAVELLDSIKLWFAAMNVDAAPASTSFGAFLAYRENDVGREMLSAMIRYSMNIHLTAEEKRLIAPVEANFVRQYGLVNDICSWEREAKGVADLSGIHSTVRILADETRLPIPAVKRLLWSVAREYNDRHDIMAAEFERKGCGANVRRYMDGVRYMMSGNEEWHLTSPRYNEDAQS